MITQTIKVDLLNKIPSENIIFRQGEVGREIVFEVYNDGVAVDLDEYDVTFAIYKPDGNFVIVSGTVDNDTVTVEETEQMTAVCGRGCFDLKLSKTGEAIYTYNGFVEIDAPIEAITTINSVSTVFGLVFPDDFQEKLTAGENITIIDNVISSTGGGGSTYTAGDYISILNNVIDVKSSLISTINGKADASALNGKQDTLTAGNYIDIDASNNIDVKSSLISTINGKADASALNGKQDKLTAGTGINIDANNVISATGGGGGGIDLSTPTYTKTVNITNLNGTADGLIDVISGIADGDYIVYIYAESRNLSVSTKRLDALYNVSLVNADQLSEPFARAILPLPYTGYSYNKYGASSIFRKYTNGGDLEVRYTAKSASNVYLEVTLYFYAI